MDRQGLKLGILWLELFKNIAILFAIGFSIGVQAKLVASRSHYVVQAYYEQSR